MFILYTFGYSAINNPAGAEEFINSIMSFSPEVKILSITGILLLFLILIYEKLFNQESSSQSSSSSTKGGASKASDIPLSTLAAGAELPDYDIINSSELINSQPVSISLAPSLINDNILSITPLEIDFNHLQEWNFDGQEDKLSILKQIAPVAIKVLLCSIIAGVATLSCGLAIEALIKGQQFLPTMLELANSMSSFLGISSSTLLAVAFVPMVALTILSVLSKSSIYAQENTERVLEKSQSVEVVRVVVRSNSEERNPKSKVKVVTENVSHKNHYKNDWRGDSTNPFSPYFQGVGNCSNQQTNRIHQEVDNDDWRNCETNPFSNNYNCTNLTIERFLHEPEKALG
ncbi:hypothetical protein [Wolbachia endosymbiont of Folsomia candida]|uniref:hypothetical protein n=1 Tax=Wolbachia endosymbiont of Folsomia candida TaxID=169402 RepID=UPI0013002E33|nr:hypothetical protein [Wolbachia endosymbiont of Folsomia candida]